VRAVEKFAAGEDLDVAEAHRDDQKNEVESGHASDSAGSHESREARLVLEGRGLKDEEGGKKACMANGEFW
jgi:hypothetical protein